MRVQIVVVDIEAKYVGFARSGRWLISAADPRSTNILVMDGTVIDQAFVRAG